MQPPSFADLLAARPRVYAHMRPSPLMRHPLLDAWTGRPTWVKHENHNPTGAFKIRGALNLIAQLTDEERRCGVVAASTGNHGQATAMACRLAGVRCRIVVPVENNPDKVAGIRVMGAEVVEFGADFDAAREHVESVVVREGWRYVHSANEPGLIAGAGTYGLEVFEERPDVDYVFVPIGGGSGASGCCLARTGVGARAKVIGVLADGAPAFARSWRTGVRVTTERAETFAEGIACRATYDLTFAILRAELDDVVTVSEAELQDGMRAALACTHNLAEGAGAASLAAARRYPMPDGATVACVMTGGNVDARTLRTILDR